MDDHTDQYMVIYFFTSHAAALDIHTLLISQTVAAFRSARMDYRTKRTRICRYFSFLCNEQIRFPV